MSWRRARLALNSGWDQNFRQCTSALLCQDVLKIQDFSVSRPGNLLNQKKDTAMSRVFLSSPLSSYLVVGYFQDPYNVLPHHRVWWGGRKLNLAVLGTLLKQSMYPHCVGNPSLSSVTSPLEPPDCDNLAVIETGVLCFWYTLTPGYDSAAVRLSDCKQPNFAQFLFIIRLSD